MRSYHSVHNVVGRGVLQALWEELAGQLGHRDQPIICYARLSENALFDANCEFFSKSTCTTGVLPVRIS